MQKEILKELLKEYEKKRLRAFQQLDERKESLYLQNPELQEIDRQLNHFAIGSAKHILNSSATIDINSFANKVEQLKKKKETILSSLSLPLEYLQPTFECKKCNDTGYITTNNSTIMCSCLKQRLFNEIYNKSNITNLEQENFEHFDFAMYSDKVNSSVYGSNLSPRENMKLLQKVGQDFIKQFEDKKEKDLLFTGNPGLGKTFLSNCIAKEIMEKGYTVLYQTAPILLDSIIDYRFGKKSIPTTFYDTVLDVDLLIIDDLGTESMNTLKFTELFNIINSRILNKGKKISKTIISTNLTLQNLFSNYDERIVSRLVGYYTLCRFYGEDIRFKRIKK